MRAFKWWAIDHSTKRTKARSGSLVWTMTSFIEWIRSLVTKISRCILNTPWPLANQPNISAKNWSETLMTSRSLSILDGTRRIDSTTKTGMLTRSCALQRETSLRIKTPWLNVGRATLRLKSSSNSSFNLSSNAWVWSVSTKPKSTSGCTWRAIPLW